MPVKKQNPAWKTLKGMPADLDYSRAVKSGDRKAVQSAASRMRTAQRRAGIAPPKLVSVAKAVEARTAYEQAVASGDAAAIRRAAAAVTRIQKQAGVDQPRDRRGRFT